MSNERSAPPVRVALLGTGYIAKYHLEALRAVPGVSVVAVCDLRRAQAEAFARSAGIPGVFTDLGTMLAEARPDVVHVLLPPAAHASATIRVLEGGAHAFVEKPICLDEGELASIRAAMARTGRKVGVGHNFLFADAFERLARDVHEGRLGRVSRVDVVWSKELGQLRSGPFDGWLFARPENVLFEVGPHVFASVVHLVGAPADLVVRAEDRVELPLGRSFARRWDVLGSAGSAGVRMRLAFADGYPEHFVSVRGTSGTAIADLENDTYVVHEHSAQMLDVDRFLTVARAAAAQATQAGSTLGRFVLSKLGLVKVGTPFGRSIARCVGAFYAGLDGAEDPRVSIDVGGGAVALAHAVADAASFPPAPSAKAPEPATSPRGPAPTVLVLGGTGFIGRALVRKLRAEGHGVRLLARHPGSVPEELRALGVDVARGDLTDLASIEAALDGIRHVYHLARGDGSTWEQYLATDVEPTRALAEAAARHGVETFAYASSIAIYYAGRGAGTITESTPPHEGMLRSNLYARSKVENEKNLLALHREKGLPVVIFRPGIVLGRFGHPLHWGVAAFPYGSVSRLWGDGTSPLPIVLVDDCADAMVRALGRPEARGQSFNLVGEPCLTANDYLDELERCTGMRVRRVPTSSLRYFAEELGKYAIKTVGRDPHRRRPSYADWEGRTFRARFDAKNARELLGWKPTASREVIVREGIEVPARQFLA